MASFLAKALTQGPQLANWVQKASSAANVATQAANVAGIASQNAQAAAAPPAGFSNLVKQVANANGKNSSMVDKMTAAAMANIPVPPVPPQYDGSVVVPVKTGASVSTYMSFLCVILLLIGVILIVMSQSKCKDDPNGDACKNHKIAGIVITVLAALGIVITVYVKFRV